MKSKTHVSERRKESQSLTPRETEVMTWLKNGKTNWEIAVILGITERTVKFHITNIMSKLNASTRSHAVALAFEGGLNFGASGHVVEL